MKAIISSVAVLALLIVCGCSTTHSVSQMQGHGNKIVYNAPFDPTWRAAVDAAQMGELRVIDANRDTGFIAAKRGLQPETFGENVGVWITREGPNQTGVEVVSRQAGPPLLWLKNWEKEVHSTIAANLTREAPYAVGAPPASSGTVSGSATTVPGVVPAPAPATVVTPAVPAPAPAIIVAPATTAPSTIVTRQDAETQIRTLQEQQRARELALQQEQDAQRRTQLQREIDTLKTDLQRMQQRLNQLEQEQQRIAPAP